MMSMLSSTRCRRSSPCNLAEQNASRGSELVGQLPSLPDSRRSRYIAPRLPQSPSTGVLIDLFRFIVAFDRRRSSVCSLRFAFRLLLFRSIRADMCCLVRTDFSKSAICWIVLQEHGGVERIVHSGGRMCESFESRYAPQVGELLALREAVRALSHYLTGLPEPHLAVGQQADGRH